MTMQDPELARNDRTSGSLNLHPQFWPDLFFPSRIYPEPGPWTSGAWKFSRVCVLFSLKMVVSCFNRRWKSQNVFLGSTEVSKCSLEPCVNVEASMHLCFARIALLSPLLGAYIVPSQIEGPGAWIPDKGKVSNWASEIVRAVGSC